MSGLEASSTEGWAEIVFDGQRFELSPETPAEDLAEIERQVLANPLLRALPYPEQCEFLSFREMVKMFAGGNRAGKTTVGIWDDVIQAIPEEMVPSSLRRFKFWEPPFFCRIITPDFTSTMEGVIFQKLREWCPPSALWHGSWDKAYDKQRRTLRFECGSLFDFLTYEQDLDKFGGAARHRVHFDEEPPGEKGKQIFNESRMRLVDYGGQAMFTMTPLLGMSWTFTDIYERQDEPNIAVVTADMDANPSLSKVAKAEMLRGMTDLEIDARKRGKFVHFKGQVYPELDEGHWVDPPPREHVKAQDVLVMIDPGIRWTGVLWGAYDSDNDLLVFDELKLENHTVEMVAREIHLKNASWKVRPLYGIDPSARNRTMVNAEQVEAAYGREGIYCSPAQNALEAGVLEVKRRLQHSPPLIHFSRQLSQLRWELDRYRRDDRDDGVFGVVKADDHLADCLRYLCAERPYFATAKHERRRHGWTPGFSLPASAPFQSEAPPMGAWS